MGIPSVTVLDHWVNYTDRLTRDGQLALPDMFWVGDRDAERLARQAFTNTPSTLVPNPLFEEMLAQFRRQETTSSPVHGDRFLVVCEAISEHYATLGPEAAEIGYDEFDALRFFLANIDALSGSVHSITVRPHPHESEAKYVWVTQEFPLLPLRINKKDTIIAAITDADMVVGCESTALVLGLLAQRRVICMIPPIGLPCRLPQESIESLTDLVNPRTGVL